MKLERRNRNWKRYEIRFRGIELDLRCWSIAGKFAIMVGEILLYRRSLLFSIASADAEEKERTLDLKRARGYEDREAIRGE